MSDFLNTSANICTISILLEVYEMSDFSNAIIEFIYADSVLEVYKMSDFPNTGGGKMEKYAFVIIFIVWCIKQYFIYHSFLPPFILKFQAY